MSVTKESMVARWTNPQSRPLFKGKLIDTETSCCCAQGDVLRCCGIPDRELMLMNQSDADCRVAELLGITRFESVMLRTVNDSENGCPEAVLRDLSQILGRHCNLIIAFWKFLQDKQELLVEARYYGIPIYCGDKVRDPSTNQKIIGTDSLFREGVGRAAKAAEIVGGQSYTLVSDTIYNIVSIVDTRYAASYATWELQGWSALTAEPYFLKFFFDDPVAWIKSVDPSVECGWKATS